MFFSIIIPVYNAEKGLKKCLDSVCAQSFNDFEVILIDDGSTDNSVSVYTEYVQRDTRFHSFYQVNKGVSGTRNHGLELADGEFVVFLDSDDCYKATYLQSFFDLIQRFPTRDHYWCGYVYCSDDPEVNGKEIRIKTDEQIFESSHKEIMSLHEAQLLASPCNKAYRNSIIKSNKIRMKEGLSLGEDLLFNLEYIDKSSDRSITVLNEALYEYNCFSQDSLNHQYRTDLGKINDTLAKNMLFYLEKWQVSEEQFAKYYSARYYMYTNEMVNTLNPQDGRSYKEKIEANNRIIKSKGFKEAIKKSNCYIHPLYRLAYYIGNYRLVNLIDKLYEWKRNLRKT